MTAWILIDTFSILSQYLRTKVISTNWTKRTNLDTARAQMKEPEDRDEDQELQLVSCPNGSMADSGKL
ncbi:hypothetical protein N7489_007460 [Penicillium chrysogenum]|uniref:Uncharacterized protein n=1 Tax=Penicillium chrysogenum TaxID=5076 RepID=A0ABQ8W7V8_PENCH|nr:uncharacterized protein N7489_007460 [Penicillium chrysogenum]XP_061071176.1 uncharacterized protein N7525_001558 [Penicillium rubens]KAJ5956098.1 hypothetical protein N7501_010377 [Penicillium viridicatum]KAJ5237369.1 hypothetical protein N7489_007460 [Penicillium chrysogenum]KAJ5256305.1 hypothetical protein N7505_011456 [Penicillium chrysogenum]KAJ5277327.1 hypothetical protein N7524_003480 [Penicillium chrysogenum]KAJ5843817.1 hypothetical protein N7525_001558 [Penicillium rubens]